MYLVLVILMKPLMNFSLRLAIRVTNYLSGLSDVIRIRHHFHFRILFHLSLNRMSSFFTSRVL